MSRSSIIQSIYDTYWDFVFDRPNEKSGIVRASWTSKLMQPFNFFFRRRPRFLFYLLLFSILVSGVTLFNGSLWGLLSFIIPMITLFGWYQNWIGKWI